MPWAITGPGVKAERKCGVEDGKGWKERDHGRWGEALLETAEIQWNGWVFVIKLLGFRQNNGEKEFLFYWVGSKEINEVGLHGRRRNGCPEEAGGGPRPSWNWFLQRSVRLWWTCRMEESLPVFRKEKVVFECNRWYCIDYRHGWNKQCRTKAFCVSSSQELTVIN